MAIVLSVLRLTRSFWLPFWYLLAILLSVLRLKRLLITLLVSFGHCIVCPSTYTASDYPFGIFWPLYCLSFDLHGFWLPFWYLLAIVLSVLQLTRLLVTLLVSFGHCIVCPSTYTASGYPFGIFWPLYCLSFDLHGASGYPFGIFWPLYCLSFDLHGFWLPFWYLLAIVLSVLRLTRLLVTLLVSFGHCIVCPSTYTASDYPFGIFWPLYCLSFDLHSFWLPFWYLLAIVLSVLRLTRLLVTLLVSFGHCIVCPSTYTGLLVTLLVSFGHCIVCPSTYTASGYPFGIFWPLYCLSFDLHGFWLPFWYLLAIVLSVLLLTRLLITLLVSFGHCIVCPSTYTASGYPFGIFWPLYCLSFYLHGF